MTETAEVQFHEGDEVRLPDGRVVVLDEAPNPHWQKVWSRSTDGLLSLPWSHPQSDPLGDIMRARGRIEDNYRNGVSDA